MTAINSNRAIRGPVTAVPVVAGKGVRLREDIENNRVVAEVDETVLYENDSTTTFPLTFQLSESLSNFQFVKIEFAGNPYDRVSPTQIVEFNTNSGVFVLQGTHWNSSAQTLWEDVAAFSINQNKTELSKIASFYRQILAGSSPAWTNNQEHFKVFKIVGVNRVASA